MTSQITLFFEDPSGARSAVTATVGRSVMEAAVLGNVSFIEGECGGSLACATCHVSAGDLPGEPDDNEDAMLDEAESPRGPDSRLSCQIIVTPDMDGHVFRMPEPA